VLTVSGPADEIAAFADKARPTPELKRREYDEPPEDLGERKPPIDEWFANFYAGTPMTFEAFALQPAEVDDWHTWRCDNWGTKWDARFSDTGPVLVTPEADVETSLEANGLVATPTVLVYRFDTAWSPPIAAVTAMAAQHPELEFRLRYGEPGEDYAGEVTFADGELEDFIELDVDEVLAPEEMWW
jgi:Ferredoxin-like domain in Api92-like protein